MCDTHAWLTMSPIQSAMTLGDFIIVEGFLGKSDGLRSNSAVFDENEVRALGWRQKGVIRTDG